MVHSSNGDDDKIQLQIIMAVFELKINITIKVPRCRKINTALQKNIGFMTHKAPLKVVAGDILIFFSILQ